MSRAINPSLDSVPPSLSSLDRAAIGYVALPLAIFLAGWFVWWAAIPLLACCVYPLRSLHEPATAGRGGFGPTRVQLVVAIAAACVWTLCGGAGHLLFANYDWFVRDAVLHDLVVSPWPVGYGLEAGKETLLRAPIAFYLPAALIGKVLGLPAAYWALGLWTATGATLFLLQVYSLVPSSIRWVIGATAVVILFSGFDIIGNILNTGPPFLAHWKIAKHLEWWAGLYQYSSMTTQLFWVPNHALGAWLVIGLLMRHTRSLALNGLLPLLLVAAALWSQLSALGLLPFVAWQAYCSLVGEPRRALSMLQFWVPAVVVGGFVGCYSIMDIGGIPGGMSVHGSGAADTVMLLLNHVQFFLLEAGFIGYVILVIRRSVEVVLALVVLALLPLAHFGPGNDLVMRASIPSLAVLAISACLALSRQGSGAAAPRARKVLICMLAVGAVTPVQEFARAVTLPSWPADLQMTLIGTNCGAYPAHYVARLNDEVIVHFLRQPYALSAGLDGKRGCANPASFIQWRAGLLDD